MFYGISPSSQSDRHPFIRANHGGEPWPGRRLWRVVSVLEIAALPCVSNQVISVKRAAAGPKTALRQASTLAVFRSLARTQSRGTSLLFTNAEPARERGNTESELVRTLEPRLINVGHLGSGPIKTLQSPHVQETPDPYYCYYGISQAPTTAA